MPDRTIQEILSQLAELRERLPVERAEPVSADSTWLTPAERDDRLRWALAQAGAVMVEMDQEARVVFVSPNAALEFFRAAPAGSWSAPGRPPSPPCTTWDWR